MQNFDPRGFAISIVVLLISLTIHELAHAKSAEAAGDDTARRAGRISLNPLDHLDPVGTLMMILSSLAGFGLGWAKPVPINPMKFRHPRMDSLKVSLWGPASNLLMAGVAGQSIRFGYQGMSAIALEIVFTFVLINLVLALFNLIPIAPLDGSHILSALLPVDQARAYEMFMHKYGFMILIGLVAAAPMLHIDVLGAILRTPADMAFTSFTGHTPGEIIGIIILKGGN